MNRLNKKLVSIFVGILMLPVFGFTSFETLKEVSFQFYLPKFEITLDRNKNSFIQIDGWTSFPNQKGYSLPRSLVKIPIPQNYGYSSFTLNQAVHQTNPLKSHPPKINQFSILSSNGIIQDSFQGNNPGLLTYISTISEDNQQKAVFVVCPFEYDEKNLNLNITKSFTVSVTLKKINLTTVLRDSTDIPYEQKYHYCIILPKAKVPLFQEYKSFMEDRGIRTILYPLEEIYSTYQYSNNPANIRAFLKDFYKNHEIETVLLVGTVGTIPMKQFYPTGNKNEEPVLSDLYYSELSTNWDDNPYPGKLETDLKDFDPEIAIGRLPFDNSQEITDYLSRILQYYQTIDQRKKSVLCAGAWISFKEDDGIVFSSDMFDIDGGRMVYKKYQTYFPTYTYEGFFEQNGIKKSQVAAFGNEINYNNVKGSIWQSNPVVQLLSGHGNYSGIYRKIWSDDKNKNGVAETDEVTYDRFYDEKTPSSSSIYLVDSCSTCQPHQSNLGMTAIKKSGGGYMGFASEVYFIVSSTCKDPTDFEASTSIYGLTGVAAKHLNQQSTIGESIKKSLKQYRDLCFVSLNKTVTQYQAKNIFATCYYGDPYLKLSSYPVKDFETYISQGKGNDNQVAFGIRDVSISKAVLYDSFKVKSVDSLKGKNNYIYTISIDSNKDQTIDYSYKIGFASPGKYVQDFYQNDQYKSIFGHYALRLDVNDFWIQLPRSLIGNSYRYQISLTNIDSKESDTFIGSFPKEDTPPVPPPSPPKETIPPKPPLITKYQFLDKRISLDWIPSQQGSNPLAGYEIYRKEDNAEFAIIAIEDPNQSAYIDQFVFPGKTYRYRIRSFDNQSVKNYSSYSNEVSISIPVGEKPPSTLIPPTAPIITRLQNIDSRVYLGWSASVPGTNPLAGYEIYRKEDSQNYVLMSITDGATLQLVDQFVVAGKTYTYQIRGFDNQSPQNFSSFSVEKSILITKNNPPSDQKPPQILPPSPPILKGLLRLSDFSISLEWSKSMDGTFPIAGYELYRSDQENSAVLYKKLDAFTNQWIDLPIEENKIYIYYLVAFDNQTPPHKSISSNLVSVQVPNKPKPVITIRLTIGSNIAIVGSRFIVLPIEPFTYKGRAMVPIRFIGEAFGARINWVEDESKNGEGLVDIYLLKSDRTEIFVTFHTLETKALYRVYQNGALVKDQEIQMDVPAFIVKPANRTVVPIRFIAETFEAKVGWDELNEEIKIEFSP